MATRDTSYNVDCGYYFRNYTGAFPGPGTVTIVPDVLTAGGIVSDGGPVRDYRAKIARGDDATSFLNGSETVVRRTHGYAALRYINNTTSQYADRLRVGMLSGASLPTGNQIAITKADAIAAQIFYKKARSAQTSIQGGVFVREIGEAVSLIRHPFKNLVGLTRTYFSNLKKRLVSRRRALRPRVLRDTWLEFQFGALPLMSDMESGAKALAYAISRTTGSVPVFAIGEEEQSLSTTSSTLQVQDMRWVEEYQKTGKALVIYRGRIYVQVGGSSALLQNFGFDLSNFLPSLYNVIPYSFIADYFSNTGDIIDAFSFNQASIKWIAKTTVQELSELRVCPRPIWPTLSPALFTVYERQFIPSSLEVNRRVVTRTSGAILPIPSLEFKVPGYESLKWLNIAALLREKRSIDRLSSSLRLTSRRR